MSRGGETKPRRLVRLTIVSRRSVRRAMAELHPAGGRRAGVNPTEEGASAKLIRDLECAWPGLGRRATGLPSALRGPGGGRAVYLRHGKAHGAVEEDEGMPKRRQTRAGGRSRS